MLLAVCLCLPCQVAVGIVQLSMFQYHVTGRVSVLMANCAFHVMSGRMDK